MKFSRFSDRKNWPETVLAARWRYSPNLMSPSDWMIKIILSVFNTCFPAAQTVWKLFSVWWLVRNGGHTNSANRSHPRTTKTPSLYSWSQACNIVPYSRHIQTEVPKPLLVVNIDKFLIKLFGAGMLPHLKWLFTDQSMRRKLFNRYTWCLVLFLNKCRLYGSYTAWVMTLNVFPTIWNE
jgi:hypothetical protein